MSTVIRNLGAMEGNFNTNPTKSFGDQGVSRFTYENVEYVCGVNATITVPDQVATAWLAADARMTFVSRS